MTSLGSVPTRRRRVRCVRLVAALVSVPVIGMPAPGTAAAPIPYRPDDKPFVYATRQHRPAHATTPLWSSYGSRSSTSRVVYLVGHSLAEQHDDGLRPATKSRGCGHTPRTRSDQPFVQISTA